MPRLKNAAANGLLAAISIVLFFAGFELLLWAAEVFNQRIDSGSDASARHVEVATDGTLMADVPAYIISSAAGRYKYVTMPEEWKQVLIQVAGASWARRWHGAIEIYNKDEMRHIGPFPPKKPGVFRVLVVGDSLTYGDGLPEHATFTSLLNAWIGKDHNAEFLNLGVDGAQSEDVLNVIKKFLPELKPDLVFYAVCLNDFLPSGKEQYSFDYEFPLSDSFKEFFIRNTRFGAFISEAYDAALRRFHLRRDFFDDILLDFDGYQKRFLRDVTNMNLAVHAAGLPPMMAMVLDQFPVYGGRGYKIAQIAEESLSHAGIEVISTEDYYSQLSGRLDLYISRWERHPNEVANYIWARMISKRLTGREDLYKFLHR
jgi:GDSL-like Lipase/Acylhydrolase family